MAIAIPTEQQLLDHACHFGHPKQKWNPKMAPYLYGTMKGIHVFDLAQTRKHLEIVAKELAALQAQGKTILFVSTKQQAVPLVERIARALRQPMVTKRWIPGLITNWTTLKKRIQYYLDLRRSFQTGEVEKYTKKEQTALRKDLAKLDIGFSGVAELTNVPNAVFVVDAIRDHVAVLEAKTLGIPVYGICDSNADPDEFTACIPANDDAVRSVTIILETIEQALLNAKDTKDAKEEA